MNERIQHNARISKSTRRLVLNESRRCCTTNDIVTEVALVGFFTKFKPEEREHFYRNHRPYARTWKPSTVTPAGKPEPK